MVSVFNVQKKQFIWKLSQQFPFRHIDINKFKKQISDKRCYR